ncbi:hypothetical protein BT96DRAFT_806325, partial [Gymnopus androsaceus JB14]
FGHAGHLFAGSDDGTLRVYDLSSFKVLKAIRGLQNEISSIACFKRPGSELRDAWIACGNHAFLFRMDTPSMIMTVQDAITSLKLTEDDDVLNEIVLDSGKKHLAFSTDLGVIGVVELSSQSISKMKEKHTNICACVKFIPDRPREIVSAGYDETFLHFDFLEGDILSQCKISSSSMEGGVLLSPPFVMSTAFSSTGILAAGTADGRLWIGLGGQKTPSKSKARAKSRKWNGLKDDEQVCTKVADGPVVAMCLQTYSLLLLSSAQSRQWRINSEADNIVEELWRKEAPGLEKVNALVTNDTKIIIGGFAKDGKGIIEIWDKRASIQTST